jgi:hypothetical protein
MLFGPHDCKQTPAREVTAPLPLSTQGSQSENIIYGGFDLTVVYMISPSLSSRVIFEEITDCQASDSKRMSGNVRDFTSINLSSELISLS